MKPPPCALAFSLVWQLCAGLAWAAAERPDGSLWVAEIGGPTAKCRVPQSIRIVAGDAIISGKIRFRGKVYVPYGRLEDSLDMTLSLIRSYNDPKPLLSLTAKADGTWNGTWSSQKKGCHGAVRVTPRTGS